MLTCRSLVVHILPVRLETARMLHVQRNVSKDCSSDRECQRAQPGEELGRSDSGLVVRYTCRDQNCTGSMSLKTNTD